MHEASILENITSNRYSHLLSAASLQFTTSPSALPIPILSPKCAYAWVRVCVEGRTFSRQVVFFINHNLCVGSGIRTFSAPFCAYATFINETQNQKNTFTGRKLSGTGNAEHYRI